MFIKMKIPAMPGMTISKVVVGPQGKVTAQIDRPSAEGMKALKANAEHAGVQVSVRQTYPSWLKTNLGLVPVSETRLKMTAVAEHAPAQAQTFARKLGVYVPGLTRPEPSQEHLWRVHELPAAFQLKRMDWSNMPGGLAHVEGELSGKMYSAKLPSSEVDALIQRAKAQEAAGGRPVEAPWTSAISSWSASDSPLPTALMNARADSKPR